MLVLTRKQGESIMIGDQIKIVVSDIAGGRVRIGFEAPDDVMIYRGEIFESMQKETIERCVGMDCYVPVRNRPGNVAATITKSHIDNGRAYVDIELINGVKRINVPLANIQLVQPTTDASDTAAF